MTAVTVFVANAICAPPAREFVIIGFPPINRHCLMTLPRRLLSLLCATTLALSVAACAAPGQAQQMKQGSFQLVPRQSVDLAPGVALAFDKVDDSRCPPDVKCIWAGKLSYTFALKTPESAEVFTLGPDRPEYTSPALHGARIVLDTQAIPAPRPSQAAAAPHPVMLKVIGQ
jgi:hypothetical protein